MLLVLSGLQFKVLYDFPQLTFPHIVNCGVLIPTPWLLTALCAHTGCRVLLSAGPSDLPTAITSVTGHVRHLYPKYVSRHPQLLSGWAVGRNRAGRPQGSLPSQPGGCHLRTLPCARSGRGVLGGCHPRGGGRRRSVGSNDLQRTQKREPQLGPSRAASQQSCRGQLHGQESPATPWHWWPRENLSSLTFSKTQAAGVKTPMPHKRWRSPSASEPTERQTTDSSGPLPAVGDDSLGSLALGTVTSDVFSLRAQKGLTECTCCTWRPH